MVLRQICPKKGVPCILLRLVLDAGQHPNLLTPRIVCLQQGVAEGLGAAGRSRPKPSDVPPTECNLCLLRSFTKTLMALYFSALLLSMVARLSLLFSMVALYLPSLVTLDFSTLLLRMVTLNLSTLL